MNGAGLLDYNEAAAFTGLSAYTLRRLVSQDKIPSKVVGFKRRFFSKDELLSWIEQNTAKKSGKHSARIGVRHA